MREYLECGPTPAGEDCVQVGREDYRGLAEREMRVYIRQLERTFPVRPDGVSFGVKWFAHDFGSYGEVVARYTVGTEGEEWVWGTLESALPDRWDDESRRELWLQVG
jgi:hypothetical protein